MTASGYPTFEVMRDSVANLPIPENEAARSAYWIFNRRLGIARTFANRIEVFIGGHMIAVMPLVKKHLQHKDWQSQGGGDPFTASMIVLPEGDHFEPISALIAVELLRHGPLESELETQRAFTRVEPIIDMALRNLSFADAWIVGLLGELLTLEQILSSALDKGLPASKTLSCWRGFEAGERDFAFGTLRVEVKTTSGAVSRHWISGLNQIEAQQLGNGAMEQIHLLSIGLTPALNGGHSVAGVTQRIVEILEGLGEGGLKDVFLANVKRYGGSISSGYDHLAMSELPSFRQGYSISFSPRMYDLGDQDVLLLRKLDLDDTFVDASEISYAFTLPDRVNEMNPVLHWQRSIVEALN